MPEREFNLSDTPNNSALIVVRGEVQDNHARNFGGVMKYGEVAVVSTAQLAEAMPTVGVPLGYRGGVKEQRGAMIDHRRQCGSWIVEHVAGEFGLEPYKYDVHLIDDAAQPKDRDPDDLTQHWRGVVGNIVIRPGGIVRTGRPTLIWKYSPFKLVDKELEHFGQDAPEQPTTAELVDEFQSARLPVSYRYADATLLRLSKSGDLKAARVEFGYPTKATFQRTTYPKHGAVNADGDRVLEVSEVSRRTYAPPVPVELQIALDDARAAANRAVAEAIERWDSEGTYYSHDGGTTDYNNEAQVAPIYNLL